MCGVPLASPDDTPHCHCPLLTSHTYVTIGNASDIALLYLSLCAPSLHMSSHHCVCQLAEFTLSSRESHFFSADHSKDRDAWVEAFTRVAVSATCSNCTMRIWLQFLIMIPSAVNETTSVCFSLYRILWNLWNVKAYSEPYKGGHVHQSEPLEWVTRSKDFTISCNVTHSKGSDWWT